MSSIPEQVVKHVTKPTTSEHPEETIKEIICLLPVKSVLKFRCVSPHWLSFIDTPICVKTHLSKSKPKILLNTTRSFCALDIINPNPKPKAETSVLKMCYPHAKTLILGSVNGVLLSHHDNTVNGVLLSHHDNTKPGIVMPLPYNWDVVLQNPYTATFHKIPYVHYDWPGPKHVYGCPEKFVFSFWYDHLTDDYKVFRNCQFFGSSDGKPFYSRVHVYSLNMKSYKQIAPCPYYMKYEMAETVFVGGALHFVVSSASSDESQWIASFDVSTEVYGLVEQPAYSSGNMKFNVHALGGCLSTVCTYFPSEHRERREVWVMKEYGNEDSWCRLISIRAAGIGIQSLSFLKPVFYSESGKQVLLEVNCGKLLWYDMKKKNVEFVVLDKVPGHFEAFVHLESLVKLSSRGRTPGDEKTNARDNDEIRHQQAKKRDGYLSKGFKLKI